MLRALLLALVGAGSLSAPMAADTPTEPPADPPPGLWLNFTVLQGKAYGFWLQAPEGLTCPMVRYRVEGGGAVQVSLALGAGEAQLMRLRGPLSAGATRIRVTPVGCGELPGQARRVTLGKASPDHSWRAGEALADVEGDALGQRQGGAVVQRIGRPAHIGLPGI